MTLQHASDLRALDSLSTTPSFSRPFWFAAADETRGVESCCLSSRNVNMSDWWNVWRVSEPACTIIITDTLNESKAVYLSKAYILKCHNNRTYLCYTRKYSLNIMSADMIPHGNCRTVNWLKKIRLNPFSFFFFFKPRLLPTTKNNYFSQLPRHNWLLLFYLIYVRIIITVIILDYFMHNKWTQTVCGVISMWGYVPR